MTNKWFRIHIVKLCICTIFSKANIEMYCKSKIFSKELILALKIEIDEISKIEYH